MTTRAKLLQYLEHIVEIVNRVESGDVLSYHYTSPRLCTLLHSEGAKLDGRAQPLGLGQARVEAMGWDLGLQPGLDLGLAAKLELCWSVSPKGTATKITWCAMTLQPEFQRIS